MFSVVLYVLRGEVVATCPPDPEPEEGSFGTWYAGSGASYDEALREAKNEFEGLEALTIRMGL